MTWAATASPPANLGGRRGLQGLDPAAGSPPCPPEGPLDAPLFLGSRRARLRPHFALIHPAVCFLSSYTPTPTPPWTPVSQPPAPSPLALLSQNSLLRIFSLLLRPAVLLLLPSRIPPPDTDGYTDGAAGSGPALNSLNSKGCGLGAQGPSRMRTPCSEDSSVSAASVSAPSFCGYPGHLSAQIRAPRQTEGLLTSCCVSPCLCALSRPITQVPLDLFFSKGHLKFKIGKKGTTRQHLRTSSWDKSFPENLLSFLKLKDAKKSTDDYRIYFHRMR
ncbi:uncharacterized protein LOC130844049 isoform X2 [Hippopotamus amphibius kiboko]|uniref:uncharacterized protein LOC130844049 isoform X2 n=1 Tax=Hippopotamus amphibius kiboko TaxID=575201 RepID=UPI0025975D41|nr:uncharacterized protein LOC130844049 isoform X2 [Hippopotamus amphibius kiboko]